MGYKTEINYILKCSTEEEGLILHKNLQPGSLVKVSKSGLRTFILNAPIMIADHKWTIVGMCSIQSSTVSTDKTELTAKILTVFSKEESEVVSKVIQDGERAKE